MKKRGEIEDNTVMNNEDNDDFVEDNQDAAAAPIVEEPEPEIEYLTDLLPAIIKRGKLEKWYGEPFWEKVVPKLYVRIMVGQDKDQKAYRIAEIIRLMDSTTNYKLGKKECNQLVVLKIGDNTKNFEMKYLSNEKPTESEYAIWKNWHKKNNFPLPSKKHVERLEEQIKYADTYILTEEDIEKKSKEE